MQAGVNSGSRASPTNQTRPRFVLMTERLQIPPLKIYTGYIMNGNNGVKKLVYLKRIKKLRPPPVNHPKVELLRMSSLTVEWSVKVLGSMSASRRRKLGPVELRCRGCAPCCVSPGLLQLPFGSPPSYGQAVRCP